MRRISSATLFSGIGLLLAAVLTRVNTTGAEPGGLDAELIAPADFSIVQDVTGTPALDYYAELKPSGPKFEGTSC